MNKVESKIDLSELKDKLVVPKSNILQNISKNSLFFYAILVKILILNDSDNRDNSISLSSRSISKITGLTRYYYLKYLDELSKYKLIKYEFYNIDKRNFLYTIYFLDSFLDYKYLKENYKKDEKEGK